VTAALGRLATRYSAALVALWLLLAAGANLAIPQLEQVAHDHSQAFFPTDADSSRAAVRIGQLMGDSDANNLAYVVLSSDRPLGKSERAYYDQLVAGFRARTADVRSVMDLWSQPLAKPIAESPDQRAVYALIQLAGPIGDARGTQSVAAVRNVVSELPRPPGLRVYVTGPGVSIVDNLEEVSKQLLVITGATVIVIALLLFLVYRSQVTAAIPLIAVGLALAVARPVVAVLGQHGVIEVSIFSVALMAAMVLGAGTDYGIFLIGRYHENRRQGLDPEPALTGAYRSVVPVIVASALTIAAALACLRFSKVNLLRSAGIPCGIGVLVAMAAALTLLPALIALASRRGLIEPRPTRTAMRWRRIGTMVVRWPAPLLVVGSGFLMICALPLLGARPSYDVPRFDGPGTESNLGYKTVDEHFPPNRLTPQVALIQTDHDLRNPAGLIAIERVSRQLMATRGVESVQSASRPAGARLTEASMSHQVGTIGGTLAENVDSLLPQLDSIMAIQSTIDQLSATMDDLDRRLDRASAGLAQVGSGTDDLRSGMRQMQDTVTTISSYMTPLRDFTANTPDCPTNLICAAVRKVLDPVDAVTRGLGDLSRGTDRIADGSGGSLVAVGDIAPVVGTLKASLAQLRKPLATMRDVTNAVVPQLRDISGYLTELGADFDGSGEGGFYLPRRTFDDPRFKEVSELFFSPDGRSTRLLIFGSEGAWSPDGARLAGEIPFAIVDATKEGTLKGSSVFVSGTSSAVRDLMVYVERDFVLLTVVSLALIFLIVALMLGSPVAGIVVVSTVIVSYASALGVSVLIWQYLVGQDLYFAVPSLAFIALVAVGADYNLLLAVRIKEELGAGLKTAIIRAFGGTGGVVTTAGIVFGITMFALMASTSPSIVQIGTTIGIGLLIDTLVVRTIVMPSIMALLGPWFWWPLRPGAAPVIGRRKRRTVATTGKPPAGTGSPR
jgi:putative drug exporter of the RND superfamily